jgi:hypothetical protein
MMGRFANINRSVSGPTHDKELPVGKHPLQLYSQGTPNGVKVTVMLEELLALGHKGAEYDAWLIRIGEGDQFGSGWRAERHLDANMRPEPLPCPELRAVAEIGREEAAVISDLWGTFKLEAGAGQRVEHASPIVAARALAGRQARRPAAQPP